MKCSRRTRRTIFSLELQPSSYQLSSCQLGSYQKIDHYCFRTCQCFAVSILHVWFNVVLALVMYMNWAIVQLLSIGVLSKHKEDIIVYIVLTLYRSLDPWVYGIPPKGIRNQRYSDKGIPKPKVFGYQRYSKMKSRFLPNSCATYIIHVYLTI